MSEDEMKKSGNEEAQDEVEAHRHSAYGNEEPAAEGEKSDDDEVEAHAHRKDAPGKY